MLAITAMFGQGSFCLKQESLENKHLIVEGEYWYPYLFWLCPGAPDDGLEWEEDCPGNRTYDGVMWHLILFMKQARNFTFSLIDQGDYEWGSCSSINNCTGMIGVVNRGEADFALGCKFRGENRSCHIIRYNVLGPFDPTYSRSQSVDFSSAISMGSYDIIIPLNVENDAWSFVNPYDYEVWIFSLATVPIMIFILLLGDFLVYPAINLDTWLFFVFRNVLSESWQSYRRIEKRLPGKKLFLYQILLISVWVWPCFLLVKAFSGNLTAMIARPKLDLKFKEPEDLLYQDEIKLVVEDEIGAIEYMRQSLTGSTMRNLIEKTKVFGYDDLDPEEIMKDCFTNTDKYVKNKNYAAICDIDTIKGRLSHDFSETGKCNWYITQKSLFQSASVMVFQVSRIPSHLIFHYYFVFLYFPEREPLPG